MSEIVTIREDGSRRVQLKCDEPSMTKQSEKDESDINKIIKRFEMTGVIPLSRQGGWFGDVSELTDYRTAVEQVRAAEEVFMKLPATLRAEFQNDPAEFLDWIQNPANAAEAVKLGIVEGPVAPSTAPSVAPVPGNSPA